MCTQIPDSLVYEGEYLVTSTMLTIPEDHSQIIDRDTAVMIEGEPILTITSICWRGYIALWEIKNGRLYLNGFTDEDDVISKYETTGDSPILADWTTDEIEVPLGNLQEHYYIGEQTLVLKIVNGRLVKSTTTNNMASD